MKKYIIYSIIFGLLFSTCNPNKDIYDNIRSKTPPFKFDIELTLLDADYETISDIALDNAETPEEIDNAQSIADNLCFSIHAPASMYVGAFLDEEYIAPDSNSVAQITSNFSVNEFDSLVIFELESSDYTAIGGVPADSAAFTYNELPGDYLPDYLASLDQSENYIWYVVFDFWEDDLTKIDSSIAYQYIDDAWVIPWDVYILSDADYESMGAPGAYHNFSSSESPEHYLPIFLLNKFAYAQAEDQQFIIFNYYASGSTSVLMDGYEFNGETWSNKVQKTDQFIQNGQQWVFDPTVHHSMVKSDYALLVEYIANHPELSGYLDQTYFNSEYYYGASSYYDNFDMRIYKRQDNDPLGLLEGLDDEEVKTELTNRLKEGIGVFLELRFPDAEPVSNGVQVFYEVYYATYEPGDYYYKMRFKCTDTGTFEFIEGPFSLN